jgi:hypothetical protein
VIGGYVVSLSLPLSAVAAVARAKTTPPAPLCPTNEIVDPIGVV